MHTCVQPLKNGLKGISVSKAAAIGFWRRAGTLTLFVTGLVKCLCSFLKNRMP